MKKKKRPKAKPRYYVDSATVYRQKPDGSWETEVMRIECWFESTEDFLSSTEQTEFEIAELERLHRL